MSTVAIGRLVRQQIVEEVASSLEESKGAVVITYAGVDAISLNAFRRKLKENGAKMLVVKNSLSKIAAEKAGIPELSEFCTGQSALLFPCEDTIEFSKIVSDFASDNKDVVEVIGGVIEGKKLTKEDINAMSKLPSKDYLYGQVVGAISAPLSGLVGALSGVIRNLIYVIKAIEEKQSK